MFTTEFYQNFTEESIPTLLKLLHDRKRRKSLELFYEANTILISKPQENQQKGKLQTELTDGHRFKFFNKTLYKPNASSYRKIFFKTKLIPFQRHRDNSTHVNQ